MLRRLFTLLLIGFSFVLNAQSKHEFNTEYSGHNLDQIAFPLGGFGTGMMTMDGTGTISHLSIKHHPDMLNEPYAYATIMVKGVENGAKVLQAPVPRWKTFNKVHSTSGGEFHAFGYPRFKKGTFKSEFPFATLKLEDEDIPLECSVTGWSPFIPRDEDNSSLPVAVMEYTFKNNTSEKIESIFSWNSKNVVKGDGVNSIVPAKNGFTCVNKSAFVAEDNAWFSATVDDDNAVVNHTWFRGGWFDFNQINWKQISEGTLANNPPVEKDSPGATIFVPFELEPGEEKIIKLNFTWYVPDSQFSILTDVNNLPSQPTAGNAAGQGGVESFVGKKLMNTFGIQRDGNIGVLTSESFKIEKNFIKFLVGGGNDIKNVAVKLFVNEKEVEVTTGMNREMLSEIVWDVAQYKGKKAVIKIVDNSKAGWGHILADQIVFTNNRGESLQSPSKNAIVFEDFENDLNKWKFTDKNIGDNKVDQYYIPWYAGKFSSVEEVTDYLNKNYEDLKYRSRAFSDAFYNNTLPPVVTEAIAANLTILKSTTVLRQTDGRFWAWEGSGEDVGRSEGSCTHVWNYAQALPHLFPRLERSMREIEFFNNQDEEGHQIFRTPLPIQPGEHEFHAAADGQLGGIMKVYRDWRISGDTEWMKNLYPKMQQSLDYCIAHWDPRHKGVLEEPHHNTYDIEFWGPDGMTSSFYIAALDAFIEMSKELKKPSRKYSKIMNRGKKYMETKLFDGEYFYQDIVWEGLDAPNPIEFSKGSWNANYSKEAIELLEKEGPKYQYGTGVLSDGIIGMWMAQVCGLDEVIDQNKTKSLLNSVYKYNFKKDLSDHSCPQRPTYALGDEGGVLLCTWPKGGMPSLPFVYSNEVWTGIEYQVAAHLIMHNEVEKGLDIVKEVRKRYDGVKRNPYEEFEWGGWYARAMASYSLFQALTGVRYDAVDKTLYIDSKIGNDFTSFLSTESGFGNVGLKNGQPFVDFKSGKLEVKEVIVSGKKVKL